MLRSSMKKTAFLPEGTILFFDLLVSLDSMISCALIEDVWALKTTEKKL